MTASAKKRRVVRELKPINLSERLAITPREFGAALGKSGTFGYRALYRGWIKAISDCGRLMIPISEVQRFLARASEYNPTPKPKLRPEPTLATKHEEAGQQS